MEQGLVTIITPCYNGEEFLEQYFASILAQTYENLELIFVNDGSSDRTEEIALSFRDALESRGIVFKYLYQPNAGQASAMNTGFREMTGEYLVWPDSDDLMTPDSIEKRVRFLEENPSFGMVRSNAVALTYDSHEVRFRFSNSENRFREDIFLDLILEDTYCACGCYMIRTDCFREIYPDLRIKVGQVGQNWQILIPMAGKHLCGYIDEDLYQVILWPQSHSRKCRTLEQEIDRQMGLKETLLDGICRSGRMDREYQKIVDIKYLRILFHVHLDHGDKAAAQEHYARLTAEDAVAEPDRLRYLETFDPAGFHVYRLRKLVKRGINKMKRFLFGNDRK